MYESDANGTQGSLIYDFFDPDGNGISYTWHTITFPPPASDGYNYLYIIMKNRVYSGTNPLELRLTGTLSTLSLYKYVSGSLNWTSITQETSQIIYKATSGFTTGISMQGKNITAIYRIKL
jgi:hypothetical protein